MNGHEYFGFRLSFVSSYGGENKGTDYWVVYKIENIEIGDSVLIKYEGTYDSWNGVDWKEENPIFVKETKKTISIYEQIYN